MAFGDLNHNTRSKILKNVHKFLHSSAQLSELSVIESCDYTCLAIITPAEKEKMTYQGWQDFGCEPFKVKAPSDEVVLEIVESDDEEEEEVPAQYCEVDIKAEEFQQNNSLEPLLVPNSEESVLNHSQEESIHSQDSETNLSVHNNNDNIEMSTPIHDRPAKPFNPRKPPRWLKDIMKKCETVTGTVRGWTCAVCKQASFNYYKGMKLHLLNTHFKQHMKTFKIKPTAAAPQNDDDRHEYDADWIKSILRQSRNEEADNWNCILCNNFTGKTLNGTKSHIVKIHCKRRETEDDAKAAEESSKPSTSAKANTNGDSIQAAVTGPEKWKYKRHKRDSAWIKDMMEKSQTGSSGDIWNCCICHDFITISDNGIRGHIYKDHCEVTSDLYKETDESEEGEDDYLNELDSDDDDFTTKKRVKQFNREKFKKLIEKTIDNCETQGVDSKSWECVYCKHYKFSSSKGIRCHLVKMHRKEMKASCGLSSTPAQQNLDKYKKKISTDDGLKEVWACPSCNSTVFNSEDDIRAHINAKHRSNGKLKRTPFKKSMLKGRKLSLNGFSPLRSKIHRRATIGGRASTVDAEPESQINVQVKMEVDETEEVNTDVQQSQTQPEPSSKAPTKFRQLSSVEKIWTQECLTRSKIDNGVEDYYKCWLCKNLYLNRCSARYHMIVSHFPFWRRGPADFAEHYKQFLSPEEIEEFRHIDEEEEGEGDGDDWSGDETVSEMTENGVSGKSMKASEMTVGERHWLQINIAQSKKTRNETEKYWNCKMCKYECDKPGTFRAHMIRRHVSSLRDNPDYEQIIAQAIEASATHKIRTAVSEKPRQPTGKFLKASQMTDAERAWLAAQAKKSRKIRDGSEFYWQCCFCDVEADQSKTIR